MYDTNIMDSLMDMLKPKKRSPRVTHMQLSHLVQFMEENEDFSCGKLTGSLTCAKRKELWKNLEILLNSDTLGPQKNVEQWRKCWNDQKSHVKLKSVALELEKGASNAPSKTEQLTDLELRILNIIKNTSNAEPPVVPEGNAQMRVIVEDDEIAPYDDETTSCNGTDNLFQSTICSAAAADEELTFENNVRKRKCENPDYVSTAQIAAKSFEEIATKKIAVLERLAAAVETQTSELKKQTFLLTEIVEILKSNKT